MPVKERSHRILIIDDDPRWIEFAKTGLGEAFEVKVATDLKKAMTRLQKNHYDVIIVSSRQLEVVETIRHQYPDKRVVVATGQETTSEAISAYRLGVFDYFAKDFRPQIITEKLFEAIRKPVVNPI